MQRFWVNVVSYLFVDAAALLVLTQPLEVIIPVLPASPSTHDWGRDMKGMGIELVHHTCVMNRRHPGSRAVGTECGVVLRGLPKPGSMSVKSEAAGESHLCACTNKSVCACDTCFGYSVSYHV